jgi:hypothetical protein
MTISIGPIRFLLSASRNSATVFASTPALRAPEAAVRAVVRDALRACCWRPRAWPPLRAAALRLEEDDERELDEPEREEEERLAEERLAEERLPEERLPDDLLPAEWLDPDERPDPLDRLDPPDPPLLRRSAMSRSSPWSSRELVPDSYPRTGTISPRSAR